MNEKELGSFFRGEYEACFGGEMGKYLKESIEAIERSAWMQGDEYVFVLTDEMLTKVCVSPEWLESMFVNERLRFKLFQDPDMIFISMECTKSSAYRRGGKVKCYRYCNGSVSEESYSGIERLFKSRMSEALKKCRMEYADDYADTFRPIELRFASRESQERYMEAMKFCISMGDKSLLNIVEGLLTWQRISRDHYVLIGSDICNMKNMSVAVMVDGECELTGLLDFEYEEGSEKCWTLHT